MHSLMKPVGLKSCSMLTPLGAEHETMDALIRGVSGLDASPGRFKLRNDLAGVIHHPVLEGNVELREKLIRLAVHVGEVALQRAGMAMERSRDRVELVFGTSLGHLLDEPDSNSISDWAGEVARRLCSTKQPVVVSTACSAASDATMIGASMLQEENDVEAVLVIGVDIVTDIKRLAHSTLGTLTDLTPRPFDQDRSGMVIGDAAGAVVLTRYDANDKHTEAIVGIGMSNDATGVTAPDQTGRAIALSLERAMCSCGIKSGDVAVYLGHGTGTRLNDELEANAVASLFDDAPTLQVFGTKGALGHSLGACGIVELIVLAAALRAKRIPPTVGLRDPIPSLKHRVLAQPIGAGATHGITMTLGFGGFNTAIVVRS